MPHSAPFADSITGVELWSFVTDTAEQAESVGEVLRFIARPRTALRRPPAQNLIEWDRACARRRGVGIGRSEEHTSELQSRPYLVCRLLLGKKKKISTVMYVTPYL